MAKKGTVFIFSAPSGAGKTTIAAKVASQFPEIHIGVSHTTRIPRGTERDKAEYFFVSKDEFLKMERDGKFLEILGSYDPTKDPAKVNLHKEKVSYWLEKGATVTGSARGILKREGLLKGS